MFKTPLPLLVLVTCLFGNVRSAFPWTATPISSYPAVWPGMPTTPYGPDWQSYYEVNSTLPNVTVPLPRSYAGSVSVNREGHPNNTLFFLAFEKEGQNGSLVANDGERINEPWVIWLNGGPGSSSLIGAFVENGPILVSATDPSNTTYVTNPYSWHRQADIFYIDQPVGTGYSTADADAYVPDEDQMGRDFAGFLTNLVSVFPSLKKRPLYITGESYGGVYIPYIAKTIFGMSSPPVNLVRIAIGDGVLTEVTTNDNYPIVGIIQTWPQLIGYNTTVYEYFVEQWSLCGYNITLQYPSPEPYPYLGPGHVNVTPGVTSRHREKSRKALRVAIDLHDRGDKRSLGRRQSVAQNSNRTFALSGKVDSWYGCSLQQELIDYAYNFTVPWEGDAEFDPYDIHDAVNPSPPVMPSILLNDNRTRAALHTPQKTWVSSIWYPFAYNETTCNCTPNESDDPSPESMTFLSELSKNVSMVIYEGNDDIVVAHREAELAIQNMTFGGIRGFTRPPSTLWSDIDGNVAGVIHQERNVTYALVFGAGHLIPMDKPKSAYALLEQFILGNNQTGLLISTSDSATVVGGEHTEFFGEIFTEATGGVVTGSGAVQGTYTWPSSLWQNWGSYMATRTGADHPPVPTGELRAGTNGAETARGTRTLVAIALIILVVTGLLT